MVRRAAIVSALLSMVLATSLAMSTSAAHADGGWRTVVSRWSAKCFDMKDRGTTDGTPLQQWDCTYGGEQTFLELGPWNNFLLQNQNSGKCLRPSNGWTIGGIAIEQVTCNLNDASQYWRAYDPNIDWSGANSTGAKWMINNLSNKCVDDTSWSTSNGNLITQNDCVFGWREYWFGL
jgi:hypothetical protein